MTGKTRSGKTVAVEVEAGLTRPELEKALATRSRALSGEEERVVRARHGMPPARTAVLERKASGEVLDELLLLELELTRRYRAHLAARGATTPRPSAAKDRIVRELRKKK